MAMLWLGMRQTCWWHNGYGREIGQAGPVQGDAFYLKPLQARMKAVRQWYSFVALIDCGLPPVTSGKNKDQAVAKVR